MPNFRITEISHALWFSTKVSTSISFVSQKPTHRTNQTRMRALLCAVLLIGSVALITTHAKSAPHKHAASARARAASAKAAAAGKAAAGEEPLRFSATDDWSELILSDCSGGFRAFSNQTFARMGVDATILHKTWVNPARRRAHTRHTPPARIALHGSYTHVFAVW